jgi:hypothetical protein
LVSGGLAGTGIGGTGASFAGIPDEEGASVCAQQSAAAATRTKTIFIDIFMPSLNPIRQNGKKEYT